MRKRFVSAVLALIMCFSSLIGCQKRLEPVEVESTTFAMDTVIHFTAYGWDERETRRLLDRLTDDLNALDKLMSVTREDSGISWVNQSNGRPMKLEEYPGLVTPLYLTLELCRATGGALDITAYPAVKDGGLPPASTGCLNLMSWRNWRSGSTTPPLKWGGVAKGVRHPRHGGGDVGRL